MQSVTSRVHRLSSPARSSSRSKRGTKAWWLLSAVLAIMATAGIKHFLFPAPLPVRLLTGTVSVGNIAQTIMATGIIQPHKLVSVGAQASGRIIAMHVSVGDEVRQGQLLAEIDPATQRNALQNAEAVLAQDRAQRASRNAQLKHSDLIFQRAAATWELRLTSRADYDAAQAALDGAKADVESLDAQIQAAQVAVDLARVSLGYTKVIAPMDGTVVAVVAPEGQNVNAVQAAPVIVKLADLRTMTIKARISEADVPQVHPGQSLYFTILANPVHRYYAQLRAVEPAPDSIAVDTVNAPATGKSEETNAAIYYNGLFDVPNHSRVLQPSMTAQVNIVVGEAKGVLVVPTAALGDTDSDGRRSVRVMRGPNDFQTRWITIGLTNSAVSEVIEGLVAGEIVILGDSSTLEAAEAAAKRTAEGT